jgi:hypothetical protein
MMATRLYTPEQFSMTAGVSSQHVAKIGLARTAKRFGKAGRHFYCICRGVDTWHQLSDRLPANRRELFVLYAGGLARSCQPSLA